MSIISFKNVTYIYNEGTPVSYKALDDISLTIEENDFVALIGRTGCGKSTLVQHINALLHPTFGEVEVFDFLNAKKRKHRKGKAFNLRKKVGLVFQFPEYQLFEETVLKDVAFGPRNFGYKEEEAVEKSKEALKKVGLDESFYDRTPFELSGGEKRRVAIAGILASSPDVLVVDEPTAGLDPQGAREVMELFKNIHEDGLTLILVTHDMNLVLDYANKVIVMDGGKINQITTPTELFKKDITSYSLEEPLIVSLAKYLESKGKIVDLAKYNTVEKIIDYFLEEKHG